MRLYMRTTAKILALAITFLSSQAQTQPLQNIGEIKADIKKMASDFNQKTSKTVDLASLNVNLEQLNNSLLSEQRTNSLIKEVKIDLSNKTRGPNEVAVFEQVSYGTVIITTADGIGSGALVTQKGHIVTNLHVVGNSKYVSVFFKPVGKTTVSRTDSVRGEVIKVNGLKDLALVKVESIPPQARPIGLATSTPKVGADAHAIGHPRGEYWTYTKGYVSAIRNDYKWSSDEKSNYQANIIQTQTPINPGNSGGPLISDERKLIGINSFILPNNPGLNYAVSVDDVRAFLKQEGSKTPPTSKPTSKAKAAECGDKPSNSGTKKDDVDGEYEFYAFDTKCNGKIDMVLIKPKSKKRPIRLLMDTNDDGKWDVVIVDSNQDGKWDFSLYDNDNDGKFDVIGYHPDGEIKASRFEAFNG